MTENDNGGNVELKISTDKKTVKMWRRLEGFLDREDLREGKSISFQNAETGRVFAIFVRPDSFKEIIDNNRELDQLLGEAMDTIEVLEDDNALLGIIDAQNEVLQSRCYPDGESPEELKARIAQLERQENFWHERYIDVAHPKLREREAAELKAQQNAVTDLPPAESDSTGQRWAFTADAHRDGDSDFFGYKPEDFR